MTITWRARPAGLSDTLLVRLANLNPLLDLAGQGFTPQVGFVVSAETSSEFQTFIGVQRERQQPHHQALFSFGGMQRQRENMARIILAVDVVDLQFGFVNCGLECHVLLQCNR